MLITQALSCTSHFLHYDNFFGVKSKVSKCTFLAVSLAWSLYEAYSSIDDLVLQGPIDQQ